MGWESHQRYRLAVENRILRERMPDFTFHEPTGDTYVAGWWTSSRGNDYRIVITLPEAFPDECPSVFIADPSPLPGNDGPMNDYGDSHTMHTWRPDPSYPDWTRICTYKPASWSASHSLEKVLQKSMLWIEAYEGYRETGKPISNYLLDMP